MCKDTDQKCKKWKIEGKCTSPVNKGNYINNYNKTYKLVITLISYYTNNLFS